MLIAASIDGIAVAAHLVGHSVAQVASAAPVDPTTIIPTVPTIVLVLINFVMPYVVSIATSPAWPKTATKWVSIGLSALAAAAVLLVAHFGFGFAIPAWPQLIILGIVVTQASYSLLLKESADAVQKNTGAGKTSLPSGS